MKKILLSLLVISLVAVVGVFATRAYFTDTEKSTGNTFSTGTIDIAVDGQNPWTKSEQLKVTDMKPSQVAYSEYVIKNVGTNPANIWKKVSITDQTDGSISEPECVEGGGTWVDNGSTCTGSYNPSYNIASVIRYDMRVWVYDLLGKEVWWQVIYTDDMGVMLSAVNGKEVQLGMIPAGWTMKVQQSYHMDKTTTNWAQNDTLAFDITLNAEQLTNTVTMMEKKFVAGQDPTFVWGGNAASLTYGVKDDKFNYSLDVTKAVNGAYTLIAWDNSAHGYSWDWSTIGEAKAVANVTVSGNVGSTSGSLELGNLTNAKFWLVDGTYTPGTTIGSLGWAPTNWMFETALADYYNSL